jgi:hypothetical protein
LKDSWNTAAPIGMMTEDLAPSAKFTNSNIA